jgi:K+-transporting ATPase ATPase A chain
VVLKRRHVSGRPHGLSEVLYNYASTANNNGSAFAYQGTGTQWYTVTQGISMLIGSLLHHHPGAGHRRRAGRQAEGAGHRRHVADPHPLFGGSWWPA